MYFKKRDILFLLLILSITSCLFLILSSQKTEHNTVFIYLNQELYEKVPLDKNTKINVGGTNTVVMENGTVYIEDATCPDKLCIKQGKIFNSSKNIICLPNKVTVKTDKDSDIDAILK